MLGFLKGLARSRERVSYPFLRNDDPEPLHTALKSSYNNKTRQSPLMDNLGNIPKKGNYTPGTARTDTLSNTPGTEQLARLPGTPLWSPTHKTAGDLMIYPSGHKMWSPTHKTAGDLMIYPSGHKMWSPTHKTAGDLMIYPSGHKRSPAPGNRPTLTQSKSRNLAGGAKSSFMSGTPSGLSETLMGRKSILERRIEAGGVR